MLKRSLVRVLLQVCSRELGAQTICEGVETVAELEALTRDGAEWFQGFLLGRPERGFAGPGWDQGT